jgi:hypothetical protein
LRVSLRKVTPMWLMTVGKIRKFLVESFWIRVDNPMGIGYPVPCSFTFFL